MNVFLDYFITNNNVDSDLILYNSSVIPVFFPNIDDFDFAELLMFIFVEKSIRRSAKCEGTYVNATKSIHFLCVLE